jgi:hypothetical protein
MFAAFIDLALHVLGFAYDATDEEKRDTTGSWLLLAAAIILFAGVVIGAFAAIAGNL